MKVRIRPTTIADEERIIEFLSRIFSVDPRADFIVPQMLRWKYWEHRGDCEEPRSLIAEIEGQMVAHVGLWPVTVRVGDRVERGVHAMDWGADPMIPGAGMSLFTSLTKQYDFVYGIGGSDRTRSILPRLGFHLLGESLTWARPIRPWRQLAHHQSRDYRLPLRAIRNLWWSQFPLRADIRGWSAAEAAPREMELCSVAARQRGSSFFNYLQKCPSGQCQTFCIRYQDKLAGCFSLFVMQEQARVAGIWLEQSSLENWTAAFWLAQRAAIEKTDCSEIVASGCDEICTVAAQRAGLRVRGSAPVVLYRKDRAAVPLALQSQLCDSDALFLAGQKFLT